MSKKNRILEQLGADPFLDSDPDERLDDGANEFAKMLADSGKESFSNVKKGQRIEGVVLAIQPGAIIFDVGHRSEGVLPGDSLSPEDKSKYTVGSRHQLYVSNTTNGIEQAVSLSARQAGFDAMHEALRSGLPVEGKVVGENKGGYNIDLPGVRGFCPFSQMDVVSGKPAAAFIGQTFKFRVTKVSGRDVVLSRSDLLREEQAAKKESVLQSLQVGGQVTASVVKIEKFGVFVDIGGGLHALVPMSELAWSRVSSGHSVVNQGDQVTVKILKIEQDGSRPRISASIKQVEGDPWDHQVEKLETGQIVDAKITKLMAFGAFAEIIPGVEGLIHVSEMSARRRISTPGEVVKVDESVKAKIVGIDRIQRRISLSMKVLDADFIEAEGRRKIEEAKQKDDEHRGVELRAPAAANTAMADALSRALNRKG